MRGRDSFDFLAATDIGLRERRARMMRSTSPEWSPFCGSIFKIDRPVTRSGAAWRVVSSGSSLVTRSWTQVLVAAFVSIVTLLMVAVGGIGAERVMSTVLPVAGQTVGEPDPLTPCTIVEGATPCMHEPT